MFRLSFFFLVIFAISAVHSIPQVLNANAQCTKFDEVNIRGACHESRASKLANICKSLKCATKTVLVGNKHEKVSKGPALPGTMCGVSKICNSKHECVSVLNVPFQAGPRDTFYCRN